MEFYPAEPKGGCGVWNFRSIRYLLFGVRDSLIRFPIHEYTNTRRPATFSTQKDPPFGPAGCGSCHRCALGKDNRAFAVFPVEAHGFAEPGSWADEYKRIFRLFEETLK